MIEQAYISQQGMKDSLLAYVEWNYSTFCYKNTCKVMRHFLSTLKMHLHNFLGINQAQKAESSVQLCVSSKHAQIPDDHCVNPSLDSIGAAWPSLLDIIPASESDCPIGTYAGGT